LAEFLAQVRDKRRIIPLIVLDQAEEIFTRTADRLRNQLLTAIRECVTSTPLIARFVISLRDDFLPRLAEFRDQFPALLQTVLYLPELGYTNALSAITEPARQVGVEFEPQLAERILKELGIETFQPPQIQIVCSRLFESRSGAIIDQETHEKLGGAGAILRRFLGDQLDLLGDDGTDARLLLKAMVTSEGTKDVLSAEEIGGRARIDIARAKKLLLHLRDQSRLLRGVQAGRQARFELAHEYLTAEIWSWMTQEDIDRREVEDLLGREVRSWRGFRQLRLGVDRLTLFEEKQHLIHTTAESLTLLILSAVRHQHFTRVWVSRILDLSAAAQDEIATTLFEYFHNKDRLQRLEAAETIATISNAPVLRALDSSVLEIRRFALEMVGGMELEEALPRLIELRQDEDLQCRILACGALGEIGGKQAKVELAEAARSTEKEVAVAAIRAIGRKGEREAVEVIWRALISEDEDLIRAACNAVRSSVSGKLLLPLLLERRLPEVARDMLWTVIRDDARFVHEVESAAHLLKPEDAVRLAACHYATPGVLEVLSRHADVEVATMARIELREKRMAEEDEDKTAKVLLERLDQTPVLIEELSRCSMAIALGAAFRIYLRVNKKLIEELIVATNPGVLTCGLVLIWLRKERIQLSSLLLSETLKHSEANVRYWAAAASATVGSSDILGELRALTTDSATPNVFSSDIGKHVRDAAFYSLANLNPVSRVWGKPFQPTFRT
jgi:HEAT repeat protein